MNSAEGPLYYMAPEILKCIPFNYKVDVYSYALIANQIITNNEIYKDIENPLFVMIIIQETVRHVNDKTHCSKAIALSTFIIALEMIFDSFS